MVDVYRKIDRVGRWRWQGTIEYRGTPEATAHPDPEVPVPAMTLELPGAVYARTLRGVNRKLDEAEGALHRRLREARRGSP